MVEYDPVPEEAKKSGCSFNMLLIGLFVAVIAYLIGDASMIRHYGAMIGMFVTCAIGWYAISFLYENISNDLASLRIILILLVIAGCFAFIAWLGKISL